MIKEISPECDVVIVVGSTNSSNSVRLVEVALGAGARAGTWSTTPARSDEGWLDGARVGVSSGASVPDDLVMEVLARLADRGFPAEVGSHRRGALTFPAAGAAPGPGKAAAAQQAE